MLIISNKLGRSNLGKPFAVTKNAVLAVTEPVVLGALGRRFKSCRPDWSLIDLRKAIRGKSVEWSFLMACCSKGSTQLLFSTGYMDSFV